jgi:hypothetical protein
LAIVLTTKSDDIFSTLDYVHPDLSHWSRF